MKEAMKEDIKDFAKVYGPMIAFMLLLAGLLQRFSPQCMLPQS